MPNTPDDSVEVLVGCGCLTVVIIGAILATVAGIMLLASWIF